MLSNYLCAEHSEGGLIKIYKLESLVLLLLFLLLRVVLQNFLHFFDRERFLLLEDFLPSLRDLVFEHLVVVSQQEVQPVSFSVCLDLNAEIVVNSLILLLNEGKEVLCSIVKLSLFFESLEELVHFEHEHPNYADYHKVEQRQLDD
jgi:hypothetical protein